MPLTVSSYDVLPQPCVSSLAALIAWRQGKWVRGVVLATAEASRLCPNCIEYEATAGVEYPLVNLTLSLEREHQIWDIGIGWKVGWVLGSKRCVAPNVDSRPAKSIAKQANSKHRRRMLHWANKDCYLKASKEVIVLARWPLNRNPCVDANRLVDGQWVFVWTCISVKMQNLS